MTKMLLKCSDLVLSLSDDVSDVLMDICCQNPLSGLIEVVVERNDFSLQELEKYIACVEKFPQLVSLFRKYDINNESVVYPQ